MLNFLLLCAAGGRAKQNIPLLHLDQRGEDGLPAAGGTTAGQSTHQPGGKIHRDGRRRGQHRFRQYEGKPWTQAEIHISCIHVGP